MEQTRSYERVFPGAVRARYEFVEVRNAAATLQGTNPEEFQHVADVTSRFKLTVQALTDAGGQKGPIAIWLDAEFRELGWREGAYKSEAVVTLAKRPYAKAGETKVEERQYLSSYAGHKIDNLRGRVALDVEWNAKDGNLDRDLASFRALHEAALIDVGIIITRDHERTKYAANSIAELAGRIRHNAKGERIVLLGTTTTTNLEKLVPRLERGDGGGCPVLVIAITDRCYQPADGDPPLPPYRAPIELKGVAQEPEA